METKTGSCSAVVFHTILESVYTFSKLIEDDCNPFLVLLGQNVVQKSRFTSSYEIRCLASYTIIGG